MNLYIGSNFFRSMLGQSSNGTANTMSSLISDYNSIRNGSYFKLAKHYYATDGAKEATQKKFANRNQVVLGAQKEDKATKSDAEGAWKDLAALRKDTLYKQKADGTYDTEEIRKNVQKFIDGYNNAIESAQNSGNTNVLRSASKLIAQTKNYAHDLEKLGITIQNDNTITMDETVFESADMKDVKNIFAGDFSFGSRTQERMLQLASDAGSTVSGMYTSDGVTASSIGSLYDSLF